MDSQRTVVLFVIIAAVGLLAVAAVEMAIISQLQDADARGCKSSVAFNASKGRCFHS